MSDQSNADNPGDFSFEFQKQPVAPDKQINNWNAIEQVIKQEAPVYQLHWKRNLLVAASLLLLICSGIWYYYTANNPETNLYKTEFSQIKHITLPDGSKVTLNANSELRLSLDWNEKGDRQVWLNGEAYFEVEKKPATRQKFVVHTNDIDVEVLGTKFNVNTRHSKAIVSLEEGKIKLSLNGQTKAVLQNKVKQEVIEMKPGEMVKLDTVSGINLIKEQNISIHSGWVRNEFHFDNTSLKDISILIKDVYGYKVEVDDEQLLERAVTGDVRAANLQELVEVLQLTFKLKMTVENKSIKISQL
ncbi:MAG: FecR family protein [Chitinophagaceae bacterium]|nr:FecR family protein [Chitinophagaceae bacterium]